MAKRFENVMKNLLANDPQPRKNDRDPTLEELAGAVALWALQHGHDKVETVNAIADAFDAVQG